VAYVLAGKIGLQLALFHPSATPVWPPTGMTLAAFLLLGYWIWPAIFIGAFVVNVTTAGSLATSLGIASGNTLEGLLGAMLVNRFANGRQVFTRQRDVFWFLLLAALVSPTVSATLGVTSLSLGGYAEWANYEAIWMTWWLGDAVGALIVAPALLLWATESPTGPSRSHVPELAASFGLLGLVTAIVFWSGPSMAGPRYPMAFLIFSLLAWVAVRLGPRDTATAVLLCVGIAIWGTSRGYGPFEPTSTGETLLLLQAFVAVIAVTALALAVGVSERKRAEEALEDLNQTLERRIQERTRTLQATVEQLQEYDRLKSAFVGIVSHELRTPVTSIKGLAENMREGLLGPLNEKQQHYLSRIHFNAERLSRLLRELLDLSKIESGTMELRPTHLSLQEVVADLLDGFLPMARQKAVAIDADCMRDMPKVYADRDKLYAVMANLVENAVKFTPAGGRIQLGAELVDDRCVKIAVSDTGCGIAKEHLPKIFDKFYRAPSGSDPAAGAGLGLAIAKGLVELHGGTLIVESAPGKGSLFSFTLPSVQANERSREGTGCPD
jgi:signal transduction histidine kinase